MTESNVTRPIGLYNVHKPLPDILQGNSDYITMYHIVTHVSRFTKRGAVMALTNSQLAVVACGIALQAFTLILLNGFIPLLAGTDAIWLSFQAWAVYFLAGCNPKGGLKALIGYATGVAASIVIVELMSAPGIESIPEVGGMNLAMAVAVFIVVVPAIMTENLKNMLPAMFIGSGAFFGMSEILGSPPEPLGGWALHLAAAQAVIVYCAVGLLFGFITVFWRGKYEASLKSKHENG